MEKKLPKIAQTKDGEQHFSVGALIWQNNKLLIMERKLPPDGFACVAGHVDERETALEALKREVKEETNLDVIACELILKQKIVQKDNCIFGAKKHFWYVYNARCSGELKPSIYEVGRIQYFSKKKIKNLYKHKKLDYAWMVIFKKLGII